MRAAPLLGSSSNVSIHAYVDHSYVTAIFNSQVAPTAVVAPSSAAASRVKSCGAPPSIVKLGVWELAPAAMRGSSPAREVGWRLLRRGSQVFCKGLAPEVLGRVMPTGFPQQRVIHLGQFKIL